MWPHSIVDLPLSIALWPHSIFLSGPTACSTDRFCTGCIPELITCGSEGVAGGKGRDHQHVGREVLVDVKGGVKGGE